MSLTRSLMSETLSITAYPPSLLFILALKAGEPHQGPLAVTKAFTGSLKKKDIRLLLYARRHFSDLLLTRTCYDGLKGLDFTRPLSRTFWSGFKIKLLLIVVLILSVIRMETQI